MGIGRIFNVVELSVRKKKNKKENRAVEGGGKCVEKGKVQRKVQRKVQCRFIDVQHRRGLAGCGRARATTESHDAGEAQAAVRRQ